YCTISTECSHHVTRHLKCSLGSVFKTQPTASPSCQMFIPSISPPLPAQRSPTAIRRPTGLEKLIAIF
ncbi:hypothetical protein B0H10DRAFT_2151419, partial [Mycena sp. CBHHK59/15]